MSSVYNMVVAVKLTAISADSAWSDVSTDSGLRDTLSNLGELVGVQQSQAGTSHHLAHLTSLPADMPI